VFYDPVETLYRWLFRKEDLRADYLKELEVGASARVLDPLEATERPFPPSVVTGDAGAESCLSRHLNGRAELF
jgi:hypothetical protein